MRRTTTRQTKEEGFELANVLVLSRIKEILFWILTANKHVIAF
jgi:hypothetical protein